MNNHDDDKNRRSSNHAVNHGNHGPSNHATHPPTGGGGLRVEVARMIGGEPMVGAEGMALLFGVTVEEAERLREQHGTTHIPADWIKRGQRRAKEAKRWGGGDSMLGALAYWAAKDLGAELSEDADGTVWVVAS